MTPHPLTLAEKSARLHAAKPWLTHPQVMAELSARRRKRPIHGCLHVSNSDRAQHANIESPATYAWQTRADLV